MASRRQIREAAVQLLYAHESSPTDQGGADLWALINDRSGLTFDKARVKMLAHLMQGRPAIAKKLCNILTDCQAAIHAADPLRKLAKQFAALSTEEERHAETSKNLLSLTKADLGGWRGDLVKFLLKSVDLKKKRAELLPTIDRFPAQQSSDLKKIFARLDDYDDRAHMVQFPEHFPEQRDLDHLHRLLKGMKALEQEVESQVNAVEEKQQDLDQLINEASTNFDISRLSKVDLAILRLATWEIKSLPDLDSAISINEAIDLARSFSGDESATFVNGLLDTIAKG